MYSTFILYRLILIHLSLSNWAIWHTVINNELAYRYFHVGYLSWVIYLYSALCTLKPKKIKKNLKKPKKPKNLKKNPKNLGFFPALEKIGGRYYALIPEISRSWCPIIYLLCRNTASPSAILVRSTKQSSNRFARLDSSNRFHIHQIDCAKP